MDNASLQHGNVPDIPLGSPQAAFAFATNASGHTN